MVPIKWGIGKITCEWVLIALKPPCKWTPGWMGEWQMDEQKKLWIFSIINFFLIFTMLVDFCHTNNANCTYVIIHTPPPSLASLPSPHPTPPGHHRAPDWAPRATQQLPTSYPSYLHLIVDVTLLISPTFALPHVLGGQGGGGSRHGAVPCLMGGACRPPLRALPLEPSQRP